MILGRLDLLDIVASTSRSYLESLIQDMVAGDPARYRVPLPVRGEFYAVKLVDRRAPDVIALRLLAEQLATSQRVEHLCRWLASSEAPASEEQLVLSGRLARSPLIERVKQSELVAPVLAHSLAVSRHQRDRHPHTLLLIDLLSDYRVRASPTSSSLASLAPEVVADSPLLDVLTKPSPPPMLRIVLDWMCADSASHLATGVMRPSQRELAARLAGGYLANMTSPATAAAMVLERLQNASAIASAEMVTLVVAAEIVSSYP